MWKFEYDSKTFIFDILQRKTHNALWGRFMKRLLLIDNNITFFENLNIGEDLLVMLKAIYYAKKIESCDSLLYYYNKVNEKSITSSVSIKTYQMQIEVLNQIESFFRDKLEVRPLLQTKRMNIYLFCLYVSCLIGNKKMYENFRKEIKQIKGTCRPTNHFLYHIFLYCNNYFFNRIWAQIIKGVKNSLFAIQNS